MRFCFKAIVFGSWFSLGILLPVQSLLLCAHGCTLQTLWLALAVYSAAAIVAEVPSGMFADLCGRKTAYLLSCALYAAGSLCFLLSKSLAAVLAVMLLQGLGRAFSSGSVDALVIEESIAKDGECEIGKTVSLLSVFQGAGISLGALAGGFLPQENGFFCHIVIRTALLFAVGVLTAFTVKEESVSADRNAFQLHFAQVGTLLRQKRNLRYLLLCIVGTMIMQAMIETYWQPQFLSLSDEGAQNWLGILCAGAFFATICGSFLMGRTLKNKQENSCWTLYLTLAAVMAALVLLLAWQTLPMGFSAVYIALYLAVGMITVPEQTILNLEAENSVRASVLSIMSFAAQAGGLTGNFLASGLLLHGGVSFAWSIGAILASASGALVLLKRRHLSRMTSA